MATIHTETTETFFLELSRDEAELIFDLLGTAIPRGPRASLVRDLYTSLRVAGAYHPGEASGQTRYKPHDILQGAEMDNKER